MQKTPDKKALQEVGYAEDISFVKLQSVKLTIKGPKKKQTKVTSGKLSKLYHTENSKNRKQTKEIQMTWFIMSCQKALIMRCLISFIKKCKVKSIT